MLGLDSDICRKGLNVNEFGFQTLGGGVQVIIDVVNYNNK